MSPERIVDKGEHRSFDVFDTCLTRIWAKPTDLFLMVGHQLRKKALISATPEEWKNQRIKAESAARQETDAQEISLKQIYEFLGEYIGWSDDDAGQAMEREIGAEKASVRAVPQTKKMVADIRKGGGRIIYVSDMYLPQETVKELLVENGFWSEDDAIYVSSEYGKTKSTGDLYLQIMEDEGISPEKLYHLGDNHYSDVKVPKKLGIKAKHFSETQLNRYERYVADSPDLSERFRSLLAGASRLTRLNMEGAGDANSIIWDTSASVAGPILFGFVYWCLKEAEKKGVKRLYFIARDGQILLKIADIICDRWDLKIECRYLYGSRQAWHLPSLDEIGDTELEWLIDDTHHLSIKSVCERVNLKPEDIQDVFTQKGFSKDSWDRNLTKDERIRLSEIFRDASISETITSANKEVREKTIGYLRQEGMFDDACIGVVDIGWRGNMVNSLHRLRTLGEPAAKGDIHGFYFGLFQYPKEIPKANVSTYFYDSDTPEKAHGFCRETGFCVLMELFTAADHGSTVGYKRAGERYEPVLRERVNKMALDWGLKIQQDSVTAFTGHMTTSANQADCDTESYMRATNHLLGEFFTRPNPGESEAYGSFLVTEDQTENIFYELAPRISLTDALNVALFGRLKNKAVWLQASRNRSSIFPKMLVAEGILRLRGGIRAMVHSILGSR